MNEIPLEVLVRHASREVGNFFAEKVEKKRAEGYVAVLVSDFTDNLYFLRCDKNGYPDTYRFNYMTFDSISVATLAADSLPSVSSMTVDEVSICLEKPLLTGRYDYRERPAVFLWEGRQISKKKIPLEKLNVSELMKLAQQVIKDREGLVIDEAFRNKIYK